jgi:DNA repair photolyase
VTKPEAQQASLFDQIESPSSTAAPSEQGPVVREVRCRSLLNRCSIDDYSFNCYTGCAHGCVYCYARFMQRFHPHREPWGGFVDVKVNAAEVLARQLRRLPPGEVFTSSACDGWQPIEQHYQLTRRCCRLLLDAGFSLNILTKNELVLRDLDILTGRRARVGVTITTPDEWVARLWEPAASPVSARARVLREAKSAGLKTAVMFGPLLPGISDTEEKLSALFALAAEVDVDLIWTDALNPRPMVWPSVQKLLNSRWPTLMSLYRSVLFDQTFRSEYQRGLECRIRLAARRSGVTSRLASCSAREP